MEYPDYVGQLAGELRTALQSTKAPIVVCPIERGQSWASFAVQVGAGKQAQTFTVTIEKE